MALSLYRGAPQLSVPSRSYARIPQVLDMPHLVEMQTNSFHWFLDDGLQELFTEISPIQDFTGTKYELSFLDHSFREPKYTLQECRDKEITYSASLYVKTRLVMKDTGEIKEQEIFVGDVPMMTPNGTFMVNGAERVVVSQLVRSPGVYFTTERDPVSDRGLCYAKLIPYRGAWLEFETSAKDIISVKVDRKRKVSATTFLTALGMASEEEVLAPFKAVDTDETHKYMQTTLERDPLSEEWDHTFKEDVLKTVWEALRQGQPYDRALAVRIARAQLEFYRRLRPGEPPSLENSWALIKTLFFEPRRYDLGRVGRYKLNRRLGLEKDGALALLDKEDLITVLTTMIRINNSQAHADDIDHLGNRRVRAVGELMQNQLRVGLLRMERMVRERMTLVDPEQATPQALVNIRPVVAAIREFFGGSQLSQFMDQTNPLAELTHKRRLSALGPGGLSRERAGFEVRDVHYSHYGRICPIETPEGPNIGLLSSLATYARINQFGFIESPYRKVYRELNNNDPDLVGRTLTKDIKRASGEVVAAEGSVITPETFAVVAKLSRRKAGVKPFVSQKAADIAYLPADEEDKYIVAQANVALDDKNQFTQDRVEVRIGEALDLRPPEQVDYLDVSPMQIVSVSASLIPFLEHDDANRALMGSNMQRQAVPLLRAQAPLVGTGIEGRVALDSGQVMVADEEGIISSVTGEEVRLLGDSGKEHTYKLTKFARTNQGTCFNQRPVVEKGERVKKGAVLADSSSTDHGRLALGQNVVVAFMSWEGYNFEDAIVVSEALVQKDYFTSIHVEKYDMEARETKLGPEEITRDIPNVGEESLRDLDERGIIRKGAEVGPGDILVGKVTPKGETELTAEEKLLRAIFGEKSRDVKDTSLRVPHGERGKVIDVKILSKDNKDELPPGVNEAVRVWVAQTRKISVGDKMAGRHGNKGVISRILPVEDMPFLPDGRPVDIILNPIGVPSRMNLGQVLETHLGWSARFFNFDAVTPVFDGAKDVAIEDGLARVWFTQQAGAVSLNDDGDSYEVDLEKAKAWLNERGYNGDHLFNEKAPAGEARTACLKLWLAEQGVDPAKMSYEEMSREALRLHREKRLAPPIFGKTVLRDGRTGEPFEQPITVGYIYMMKLIHLVEDKIHARSTGPYSLITQQPLGGKAQFGGQRFGEMEVWALEAYSAAYNLQEMLTVKADDVSGRVKTYESIVKGEDVVQPGLPESFNVLLKELQSLGLAVELLNEEEDRVILDEEDKEPAVVEGLAQPAEASVVSLLEGPAPSDEAAALSTNGQPSAEPGAPAPEATAEPDPLPNPQSESEANSDETR